MRDERGRFLPKHAPANGVGYSRALANQILDWLVEGKSLKSFCEQPGKPSRKTIYEWIRDDVDDFAECYRAARRFGMESWADELDELASSEIGSDSMAAVTARRNQLDVRKWLMARMHPQMFGDRVAHDHSVGGTIHIFVPDNQRLTSRDDLPVIDGQAALLEGAASDGQSDAEDKKAK